MVTLDKMTHEEYEVFLPHLIEDYAWDISRNFDTPIEDARQSVRKQQGELLPQGLDTPGQRFFTIRREGFPGSAGVLWVFVDAPEKTAFIYDIVIVESLRGQGIGRAVLGLLEDLLRPEGYTRIGLQVFDSNPIARHLYESMGYKVVTQNMQKKIKNSS
jgi:ribosomal protein S18 acetylase RimI-like enzyme